MFKPDSKELQSFIKERDEVLRSLDVERVIEFHHKWNPNRPKMDLCVAKIAMHKARSACMSLSESERMFSVQWLKSRGYSY